MSDCLKPHGRQHARLPCPSPSPGVCPHSCPLNQWCHPTISSSVALFFCLQSFPASGSFPMSWLFTSGGQSTGASALSSVLPMSIQSWYPLWLIDLISLLSKGLSRVFSSTTVWKHQYFFLFIYEDYFYFFNFYLMICLQYWFDFCHTSVWINHRCTYIPSPKHQFLT